MTEIVQNNNGMKFDLLEPGNSGTGISGSDGLFNSLLGSVDTNSKDDLQECNELENEDIVWTTFVDIVVNAHPALDEDERSLVLNDYGHNDKFLLRVRGAQVDYTIQYYRLGRHPDTCSPKKHPLIVENVDELSTYLFKSNTQ